MCNSCQSFNFSGHYLRNRSTLDIGVLGYIGIVQHKKHSPEVLSIPPGAPCIYEISQEVYIYIYIIFTFLSYFKIKFNDDPAGPKHKAYRFTIS